MKRPSSTTLRRAAGGVIALSLLAGLLALGAQPTGSATPEATVAADARVAARRDVDGVAVMLTVSRGDVVLVVAHHKSKGWFGIAVDPVPRAVDTSWTATKGGDGVPALSAAYGRSTSERVRVTWSDNSSDTVLVGTDGMWLAARPGEVQLARVERLGAEGAVLSTEAGL